VYITKKYNTPPYIM